MRRCASRELSPSRWVLSERSSSSTASVGSGGAEGIDDCSIARVIAPDSPRRSRGYDDHRGGRVAQQGLGDAAVRAPLPEPHRGGAVDIIEHLRCHGASLIPGPITEAASTIWSSVQLARLPSRTSTITAETEFRLPVFRPVGANNLIHVTRPGDTRGSFHRADSFA